MTAWKFLVAGGVGRFSDVRWPEPSGSAPGAWLEADGPLERCSRGIHACAGEALLDWLDDELWEVELDGPTIEEDGALVAERGRLVRRVEAWDETAARAFVADVRARAEARPAAAPELVGDLERLAAGRRPDSSPAEPAVPVSPAAIAANVAYVAAHAAGATAGDGYDAAFAAERACQLEWLVTRLGLS